MADSTPSHPTSTGLPGDIVVLMPISRERLPVQFTAVTQDEVTPGDVFVRTSLGDRALTFRHVSTATFRQLMQVDWLATPVRLALPATVGTDGTINGELCAVLPRHLLPVEDAALAIGSPWSMTSPTLTTHDPEGVDENNEDGDESEDDDLYGTSTDDHFDPLGPDVADDAPGTAADGHARASFMIDGEVVVLFPLGGVVRFAANRETPADAHAEVHSMLRAVLEGKGMRVVDKIMQNEGF